MAETNSLSWPNLFDVARNRVAVCEDNISVVNRTRLLFLTEPTELYNNPGFGLGLKRWMWQYNSENTKAQIKDRMKEQLRDYEPCSIPDETQFADGLLFTGSTDEDPTHDLDHLKMTVAVTTTFGKTAEVSLNVEQ